MGGQRHWQGSKRKRQEAGRSSKIGGFGVADTVHETKRARLSVEPGETTHSTAQGNRNMEQSGDWETVVSKRTKRRERSTRDEPESRPRDDSRQENHGDRPKLQMHRNYKSELRISDLRDLALYVLTDGVAPSWLAVRNAKKIKKVVAMMVPGLDQEMLQNAERVLRENRETFRPKGEDSSARDTTKGSDRDLDNEKVSVEEEIHRDHVKDDPHPAAKSDQLSSVKDWLFDKTLEVRAPGDTKQSRVHSPLQAMLLAQDPEVKQSYTEKSFKPVRTPMTHYVHTADELREAEYPVHPSTFTSAADAELEATRRTRTNQVAASGWVDTKVKSSTPIIPEASLTHPHNSLTQNLDVYALDCEMVMTSDDVSSLARISVVSFRDGQVVLDKYVKPDLPITNYFTQYSGITASHLENVTTTLQDIQSELLSLFTPSTILLGHSLESDLSAMKLTHPFIIDTSMIYPHPRGLPLRSSLKFLANKYLRREIQTGGASGHDSVEDARAVLDLVKLKCEKGPKFGTTEANGEPIFKRLARSGRTSAIVEYGSSPERGLGKDATFAIGCQNDDEIVNGMLRAIRGDDFFEFNVPKGGVDFVWGRLRALEFERGWVTSTSTSTSTSTTAPETTESHAPDTDPQVLLQTMARLSTIYAALPTDTLLILYSGTSDMRPVMHLQALQQQYRKEFKVKKWDELSVKWTDSEEQELKRAVERARSGWGIVCLK